MEIKINREIQNYTESVFLGMSLRQLIFSFLAVISAVGIYFGLRNLVGTETVSWLCILCAFPFAAMGFLKYQDMSAEKFLIVYLKSEIIEPNVLIYTQNNLYYELTNELQNKMIKEEIIVDKNTEKNQK